MKTLHKFTVNKKTLVEKSEPQEDGSVLVKKVEEKAPVEVSLKLPSRRDKEQLSFIYNGWYGKAIKGGLQPVDVLRRCMLDSGGAIARKDLERAEELIKIIPVKENEVKLAIAEGRPEEEYRDLIEEIGQLSMEFSAIEKLQRDVYSRSAESYAESKTVEECALAMTYIGGELLCPGVTEESRSNLYYDYCDDPEMEWAVSALNKAIMIYYHYITTGKEDQEYYDSL